MTTRMSDPLTEVDRFLGEVLRMPRAAQLRLDGTMMPMDLVREGDHYTMTVDLPGVDPDSIDLSVEDNTLTIRAARSTDRTEQTSQWLVRERSTGTFARQIALGRGLDLAAISASYNDGVLTVTIPVAAEAKPRTIKVSRGSTPAEVVAADAQTTNA